MSPRQQDHYENDGPSGPSAADWINLGGQLLQQGIQAGEQQQQQNQWQYEQPQYYQPQRPQYYTPQPQQYRPQPNYTPAPAKPQPKPPKNEVVKKTAKQNPLNMKPLSLRATAETDARQQIEAEKAKSMLDADLMAEIQGSGNPQMIAEWNAVVQGGHKTADVDKFLAKHGPGGTNKLTAGAVSGIDLRQKFAKYGDALQSGSLTDVGKQQALADLQKSVAAAGARPGADPTFYKTLAGNVTQMNNFNTMGQLAGATQSSANPFPILVQGATQIGMPVMFVSEMTGFPVMSVPPVAGSSATASKAAILIVNPKTSGQSVNYLLDSHEFTMKAGAQQQLDRSYQITFDAGKGGAAKRYQLAEGVYEWRHDEKNGWNLYKVKVSVVIDNSRYDGDFHYLLNNEHKVVAGGDVAEHSSDRPIELAFDGGGGKAEIRKTLQGGRYLVGLDPDQGRLDLFDADQVAAAALLEPPYLASTVVSGVNATRSERVETLLAQLNAPADALAAPLGAAGKTVSPLGAVAQPKPDVDALLKSLQKSGG